MKTRKSNLRGVQSIRTHSNRAESQFSPYKAFMKLTALEMEKVRRNKEKDSALARLEALRTRFREIEAEKADLLKQLADAQYELSGDSFTKSGNTNAKAGFKLRY